MSKRNLAISEVTPERETEAEIPPAKRQRLNPSSKTRSVRTPSPPRRDSEERTRIISWNIETPIPFLDLRYTISSTGMSSYLVHPPRRIPENDFLRMLLKEWDWPEFVCLQEVRARPTDKDWMTAMCAAANGVSPLDRDGETDRREDGGPTYTAYWALNVSRRGQRRFGVCTLVAHPWVKRVRRERTVGWDAEGRVHILEFDGWALVNVYALNGSDFPWVDPRMEGDPLAKVLPQKTRNERKREFNMLLLEEIQTMRARGLRPVLIGDFNISLAKVDCYPRLRTQHPHALARKQFNEVFIPQAEVVDVYRAFHGSETAYSWFAKGKPVGSDAARVDYALVDRQLIREKGEGREMGTGYGGKNVGKSDHGIVWLDMCGMNNLGLSEARAQE
ncbi:DNase I-like protein [Dacryopinax primogenitus]|uniref:DNase I-like protein n=1 Tax=Dacryopinax primogenitus (strain DJM 731) TaxID=1858805 RepID=M5FRV6_DACPD|nr:DNase I-like protein [Dacryopinax primogenitus]EJT97794.1 DNase I-like protein [Dacryopinax primogenitus]